MKSHGFDDPPAGPVPNGEDTAPVVHTADTEAAFRRDLLELIPFLRAFSRSLCGDRELADDLAQEALAKAWQSRDTFRPGSNLKAWLFTILRNQFTRTQARGASPRTKPPPNASRSREGNRHGRFSFRTRRARCAGCRPSNAKRSFWSAPAAFRTKMPRGSPIVRLER